MLTVILLGGASRRMGADKATLPLLGATMSASLIKKYRALGEVAVSVDRSGRFPNDGAIELLDRYPGSGPINGIVSAFSETDERCIFLTATDLPNGDVSLAQRLISLIGSYDACVIGTRERFDPLFAVYSRACLDAAVSCLERGRHSFSELFKRLSVHYISPDSLAGWDLEKILTNVNTPEDYRRLQK